MNDEGPGVHAIPIADITADWTDTQIRQKPDVVMIRHYSGVIESYTEENDPVARGFRDPVEVEVVLGGHSDVQTYHLIDGFHRLEAAKRARKTFVLARLVPERSKALREAMAAAANGQHGMPLKPKDRKEWLRRNIAAGLHRVEGPKGGTTGTSSRPYKTIAQMRRDIGGCDYRTFVKWLKEISPKTFDGVFNWAQEQFDEEMDQEYDEMEMKEKANVKKIRDALTLVQNLSRALNKPQNLRDVHGELTAMLQETLAMADKAYRA